MPTDPHPAATRNGTHWTKTRFPDGGVWCEGCEKEITNVYVRSLSPSHPFCSKCADIQPEDRIQIMPAFDSAAAAGEKPS